MDELENRTLYDIFFKVIRLHYYRNHQMLERLGIYPGQPPLLFLLSKESGVSQKELAEKIHIKPATLTVMIQRMEKAGLLIKKQDEVDQRMTRIFLTEEGKKSLLLVKDSMKSLEQVTFNHISEEEKLFLRRLLLQMADNLKEATDQEINE